MLNPLLLLVPAAHAVEVTHIPPFLRGDVQVGYALDLQGSTLIEEGDAVGRIAQEQQRMRYAAVFGVAPGAAVFVELPSYLRDRVSFADGREMAWEPTQERGDLSSGAPLSEQPVYEGRGFGGTWVGLRATPWSEELLEGRGARSTWLVEFGYRFQDRSNFWTVDDSGIRGAGPGGPGTRGRLSFSTSRGVSRPYISGGYTKNGWFQTDLYSSEGELVTPGAVVSPRSSADVLTGVELTPYDDAERGASFTVDLRLGWGYQSWAEVPSGIYLPSVLPTTDGTLVVSSEYSTFKTGLGLYYRPFTYLKFDLVGDVAYAMPYKLEQPYEVYTGYDTLIFSGALQLEILIRGEGER